MAGEPGDATERTFKQRLRGLLGRLLGHPRLPLSFTTGLGIVLLLLVFGLAGRLLVDVEDARPLSAAPRLPPSWQHPFGTDDQGRDLLAGLVAGAPLTLWIGFLAGTVGLGIGIVLGLLGGYVGGKPDAVIRTVVDTLLTVPSLLVLVTVASSIREGMTVNTMALVVASLAWLRPTRQIRAQVLSMRERGYVQMARLNGMSTFEIIRIELLPNLVPYLAACFVSAVSGAILAGVGLEALGLGPQNEPTVGMTVYRAFVLNSLVRGMWWWWGPPIVFLILVFVGLFLISAGLDEVANPRLGKVV
jgi:peptide/nickel transport system permease protein